MAIQRAYVLTHWELRRGKLYNALAAHVQGNESVSLIRDFQPSLNPTSQQTLIVELIADDTRIAELDGTVHKVLAIEPFDEDGQATGRGLNDPLSEEEVTALRNWLQNKTGKTINQIAAWFNRTPLQLSDWLQSNPRREAIVRLVIAWKDWRS